MQLTIEYNTHIGSLLCKNEHPLAIITYIFTRPPLNEVEIDSRYHRVSVIIKPFLVANLSSETF